MALIVQKYGGSSLATPAHIRRAAQRIRDVKKEGNDVLVVVSAMGRMTDHLINLAHRTVARPPQRELDMLMTAGERISMALLAMALHEQGVPAISFTGSQTGIVTSPEHTEARIIAIRAHRTREELAKGKVVIVAGFQGVSEAKEITTLGRGGSDTSAVALAAALGADRCEILTDVDGLFSADPRVVPSARLLNECSYDEGLELASLGAKMHARSIEVAKRFRVHVRIASSSNPACEGTRLTGDTMMESTIIRGIATRDGFHFFRARTDLAPLVAAAARRRIPIRFFQYSDGEVKFLCERDKATSLKDSLQENGILFEEVAKVSTVAAVGDGLSSSADVLPRFLQALAETGTACYLVCTNALSVTAAVPDDRKQALAQRLHETLVEETWRAAGEAMAAELTLPAPSPA